MGKYWTRLLLVLSRFFAPLSLLVYIAYFFLLSMRFIIELHEKKKYRKCVHTFIIATISTLYSTKSKILHSYEY